MNKNTATAAAMSSEGEIVSVEETVWTLRMGSRNPPCNVAKFEEIQVNTADGKRRVRLFKIHMIRTKQTQESLHSYPLRPKAN